MPTVTTGGYIASKLSRLRIFLDANELSVAYTNAGITGNENYTVSLKPVIDKFFYDIIPELLAMPDKTQGDTSLKWDRPAIKSFYSIVAGNLDLPNQLPEVIAEMPLKPTITDKSYLW